MKTHGRAGVRGRRLHARRGQPRVEHSARSCSPSNEGGALRYVGNVGTGLRRRARSSGCSSCCGRSSGRAAVPRAAEDAARPQAATSCGSSRGSSPRSSSASGRTTAASATRPTRACATTSRRPRCGASGRPTEVVRKGKRELRLTNLDKLFWPDEGITKGDLLDYYRQVAPVLVPHLRNRPFTMRRYPDGVDGKAFFQKDAPSHMPDWIPTLPRRSSRPRERRRRSGRSSSRSSNDELALLWMVNMGCIDMNPWYSRVDRPDRPDFVLFDLDPTPEVPWAQTIEVALLVQGAARRPRARVVPEDVGRQGLPRARPARPPLDLRGLARRSPSSSPARSRARTRSSRRRSGRRRGGAAC